MAGKEFFLHPNNIALTVTEKILYHIQVLFIL
jgi:hypothetical protein